MKNFRKKIKFALNLDPRVEKLKDKHKYIPDGYKSVLIIYADFELAWAWRFSKSTDDPLKIAEKFAYTERNNIPAILDICSEFNIPITWATVGHLFLDSCKRNSGILHDDVKRIDYFENNFWSYKKGDWFDSDPAGSTRTNPEWYCPDLIDMIASSKVKHEIGCHTFSHIDCTDKNCSPEVFDSEIIKCKDLASEKGIILKSFVHPAHTIGNLDGLIKHGFTSYRTDYNNILGYPEKYRNKLWEFKSTWEFVCFDDWSVKYHIYRYSEILYRAIKNNTNCVFWFHPSINPKFICEIMPVLFRYFYDNADKVFITTAEKYSEMLSSNGL
ncbi:MAG: polysaccharide deacetylase family protein [Ignavibacteria bacterium]|nr:polysaccharide deacetylase family protein [Ignavibacteria bacterium]